MIRIANSIANSSHGWSVVDVNEQSYGYYDGSSAVTIKTINYQLESSKLYYSNTAQNKLRFNFFYTTSGASYSNSQVLFDGMMLECTNNMLYANINLLANTFLNNKSNTMFSLLATPTTVPSINTNLLAKISNSLITNSGQWAVIGVNETEISRSLTTVDKLVIVNLQSNRYKVDGAPMTISYTATTNRDGQLSSARLNINQVDLPTSNQLLYTTIISKANTYSSNTESYFIQRIE